MLRHVSLKNITHFKDLQQFDFKPGAYFFIGPNDSGKSTVFEAIRRCMSSASSTSFTVPYEKSKPSIVLCGYTIENTDKNGKLLTGLIGFPVKDDSDPRLFVKIVYEDLQNKVGLDLTRESKEEGIGIVNQEVQSNEECEKIFKKLVVNDFEIKEEDINKLNEIIADIVKDSLEQFSECTDIGRNDNTQCNIILRKYIDKRVTATFQNRSLGSIQWSQSKKMHKAFKKENYANATKKAEIIMWYLEKSKENQKELNEMWKRDMELEQTYFDAMTLKSGYVFKEKDGDIYVDRHGRVGHLLKVPEGIIEAKNSSILLSVDQFSTVCLEDPERGMHPQMITRLRDLILRKIKNKVVIIATHHQSFISSWMLSKKYLFRKTVQGGGSYSSIISGKKITTYCSNARGKGKDKEGDDIEECYLTRLLTSSEFTTLFFARSVLFVEGNSDSIIATALKYELMGKDELVEKLVGERANGDFDVFLSALQVMQLNGKGNKSFFEGLCEVLQIRCFFLLDNDKCRDNFCVKKRRRALDRDEETLPEPQQSVSSVTENNVFIWDNGNIEQAFILFCNAHDEKCENCEHGPIIPLLEKIICLQVNDGTIVGRESKFFRRNAQFGDIEKFINMALVISSDITQTFPEDIDLSQMKKFVMFLYQKAELQAEP